MYDLKYFTELNFSAVMKHKIGSLGAPIDDKAPDELDDRCYNIMSCISVYIYNSVA